MRIFRFRHKAVLIVSALLLGVAFCFGLFVFEYRGYADLVRMEFPRLTFLTRLPQLLDIFYLPYWLMDDPLPKYNVIVDAADWQELEEALADNNGDLLQGKSRKRINVEFVHDGRSYQASMQVHGDFENHWRYEKKSWQIIFDDDNLFEGKERISLILPEDRSFLSEQLSNYRARKLGLTVPDSQFAVLRINGGRPAVYFEIEGWSAGLLARAGLPDDANLYGEEDDLAFQDRSHDLLEHPAYWKKYVQETFGDFDNYAEIEALSELLFEAPDEEFFAKIPLLLDMSNFYRWQVHSILMGSTHQDFVHNVRLYFNPAKGKFEFIPWDLRQFDRSDFADLHYNMLVSRILSNPDFLHERNKLLWAYVEDDKYLEDDLRYYDRLFENIRIAFYKDRTKIFSNPYFRRKVTNKRNLLVQQHDNIRETLQNGNVLAKLFVSGSSARLELTMSGFSDVVFDAPAETYRDTNGNGFVDQSDVLVDTVRLSARREAPSDYAFEEAVKVLPRSYTFLFHVRHIDLDDPKLNLRNAVTGRKVRTDVRLVDTDTFAWLDEAAYSRDQFLAANSAFRAGTDNVVVLGPGAYQVSHVVVVPRGVDLKIMPGTKLEMAPQASLIAYGSVEAKDTVFTGINRQNWGAFAVQGAQKAVFENCTFERGGEAYINGVRYTGQLAVHDAAEVSIKNCRFLLAHGDDGLNVKYGRVNIRHCYFEDNKVDAVDLDWTSGVLTGNTLVGRAAAGDANSDGIDISGTTDMLIANNVATYFTDKGLSVGENADKSTIIFNNVFSKCGTGVAVKDGSEVSLINNVVMLNHVGLAVFQKKPEFGGAFLQVVNSIIWANRKAIELDEVSDIAIIYSDVQGGFEGKGNVSIKPILTEYAWHLADQADSALLNGGSAAPLRQILQGVDNVPMGIISSVFENYGE